MPELRQNVATKEWVIIATERAKRPDNFIEVDTLPTIDREPGHDSDCPFCPGNEEPEREIERQPETGPWQIRVVRNKYPALTQNGKLPVRTFDGVHRYIAGVGHHEVVVEHPQHNTSWALMTYAEIKQLLLTYHHRGWQIRKNTHMEQMIYFKNHGPRSGASLKHPLSQIIAMPVVPNYIRHRMEEARRYSDDHGQCVYCMMAQDEFDRGERTICANEHFVAFVLYAALSPFHLWIMPREHSVSFLYSQPDQIESLAEILHNVLRRLYYGLNDPSYNLIIHSAPLKEISNNYLHWYVSIIPRVSRTAGFELGSGMFINPALPEASAEYLRDMKMPYAS
jgi:UDPglucose--hexose-1-phosphate uridylyltransferase